MESSTHKRRKVDIEDVNRLLENNIELAADIHLETDKCIHPTVLQWLKNYNDITCGHPITLYFALMATIAHITIPSTVLQWNSIPRYLNLYAIIIGFSGMSYHLCVIICAIIVIGISKSGSVRECREALEELYEFLARNTIDNPGVIYSILDKFTEAGFIDQIINPLQNKI